VIGGGQVVRAAAWSPGPSSVIGGGVVCDTDELLKLFDALRVVQYEDANAVGDFGKRDARVARLAAQKR
jgi:hypothetical protein